MEIVNIGGKLDIQKITSNIANKLRLTSTGIVPEMHIPGHMFAGPGSRLDLRLNPDKTPKEWSQPINKIDEFCMYHDIDYESAENNSKTEEEVLNLKHEADSKLIERLNNYSAQNIGERFIKFLIEKAISMKLKFGFRLGTNPHEQSEFERSSYDSKAGLGTSIITPENAKRIAKQLHKEYHEGERRAVYVPHINHTHCADFMEFVPIIGPKHIKYRYLLTYIDAFSKYAYGFALRNKNSASAIPWFREIWKENKPIFLWTDKDRAFYSKDFLKFLEEENVKIYSIESDIKCSIIERFNKTIRENLMRRKTELELLNKDFNWLHELPKIFEDYNNTYHHTIKMKPIDVKDNEDKVKDIFEPLNKTSDKEPVYKIGDEVRIYRKIETFEKHSGRRFTNEIFKVSEIYNTNPITYGLTDTNNEQLIGKFYSFELSLVK